MFSIFLDSSKLFLRGKLFRDTPAVLWRWLVAFCVTLALALSHAYLWANSWVVAAVAGLVGGGLMPFLLRNVKYA